MTSTRRGVSPPGAAARVHGGRGDNRGILELPASSEAFVGARWDDVGPLYDTLARARLPSAMVEPWLREWSRLEELVDEAHHLALIAYSANTAAPGLEAAYVDFVTEIAPRRAERRATLARRLLSTAYSTEELQTTLRRFRADLSTFRPENASLLAELDTLGARYSKLMAGLIVDWDGRRCMLQELQPMLESRDRDVRERAFRAEAGACLAARGDLAALFDRMLELRTRVAANAGFRSYRDYAFVDRHRFDYTPADCARFRRAVERVVVPALSRVYEERRRKLGVQVLYPWDLRVHISESATASAPFKDGDELAARARKLFAGMDQELGSWFGSIADHGLLDLEARPHKAPGAFCAGLSARRLPFLFMNAVGVNTDVMALLHEAGHGFHELAMREKPLFWYRQPATEAAELASMSMELLATPHLADSDTFYTPAEAARVRLAHLEEILVKLAYVASVDEFQHWLYTSPWNADPDARDAAWVAIRQRFEPGVEWTGLDAECAARWYRQLHIFRYPFYYIEYGIAQIGALQLWAQSQNDFAGTVARYKRALAIGATEPLPEVFRAAGAELVFDAERLEPLIGRVLSELEKLQ